MYSSIGSLAVRTLSSPALDMLNFCRGENKPTGYNTYSPTLCDVCVMISFTEKYLLDAFIHQTTEDVNLVSIHRFQR